jgi:hypothetical protein
VSTEASAVVHSAATSDSSRAIRDLARRLIASSPMERREPNGPDAPRSSASARRFPLAERLP